MKIEYENAKSFIYASLDKNTRISSWSKIVTDHRDVFKFYY